MDAREHWCPRWTRSCINRSRHSHDLNSTHQRIIHCLFLQVGPMLHLEPSLSRCWDCFFFFSRRVVLPWEMRGSCANCHFGSLDSHYTCVVSFMFMPALKGYQFARSSLFFWHRVKQLRVGPWCRNLLWKQCLNESLLLLWLECGHHC